MLQDQNGLFDHDTPLIFADGTALYAQLAKEYICHQQGFFILGPSGIGKSYYVRQQKASEKHWIDADQLWRKARAIPRGAYWKQLATIVEVEQRCDIITAEAKRQGFWLLGSSCNWLKPDAIVLPPWHTNVRFIKEREKNYDGGITSDMLPQLRAHRREIRGWTKKGVPVFTSVAAAIEFLQTSYTKEH